jgi:hypothetical protein
MRSRRGKGTVSSHYRYDAAGCTRSTSRAPGVVPAPRAAATIGSHHQVANIRKQTLTRQSRSRPLSFLLSMRAPCD